MANYTEHVAPDKGSPFWLNDLQWVVITSSSGAVLLQNADGSETLINGTGFMFDASGFPIDGTVTMMRHFSSGLTTLHAEITGLSTMFTDVYEKFGGGVSSLLMGGNDTIVSNAIGTEIWTFGGNDTITAGANSFIHAAGGNDTITTVIQPALDDWISYRFNPDGSANTRAMIIQLNINSAGIENQMVGTARDRLMGGGLETDTFGSINHVEGSQGDDLISGTAWEDSVPFDYTGSTIRGLGGDDTILKAWLAYGGTGNDTISLQITGTEVAANLKIGGSGFGQAGDDTLLVAAFGSILGDFTYSVAFDGGSGSDWADGLNATGPDFDRIFDLGIGQVFVDNGNFGTVIYQMISVENVRAGGGNDYIYGDSGANILVGNGGDDFIAGDDGADDMSGGGGTDTLDYSLSDAAVTISLRNGTASGGHADGDTIAGFENLIGSSHHDTLTGNGAGNEISGGLGQDLIKGQNGDDTLMGEGGRDTIRGGNGRDIQSGGSGRDTFDFNKITETGTTGATRDRITDFTQGLDIIDLRGIDADTGSGGNNAFDFKASASFTGTAGELRQFQTAANTIVEGDVDGDGQADFQILITGLLTLSAGDFIL